MRLSRNAAFGGLVCCAVMLLCIGNTQRRGTVEALRNLGAVSAAGAKLALPVGSSVLVTGGAGFVGFHLSLRLRKLGVHVVALDNFDPYYSTALKRARQALLRHASVEVVEGDMCDQPLLERLLSEHAVTHVASMAAQAGVRYSLTNPQAYLRANGQCFVSLLEALVSVDPTVRLIYASSSSVYGSNTKAPFSESDRVDGGRSCWALQRLLAQSGGHSSQVDVPNSLYAATKKLDEQLAHVYHGLHGLRVTGLRFFTVYGPWGRPDMAYFSFAHRIAHGRPIAVYGHGTPQRDFTYIDDVVDGVVGALALGADEEIFNLGNHRVETLGRFISVLERHLGVAANKTMVGMAPGDVKLTYADVSHAAEKLGYAPKTSIDQGLKKFIEWYRSASFRPEYAEEGEWNRPPRRRRRPGARGV
jgi:UDP-glucuronate 4-epimerase